GVQQPVGLLRRGMQDPVDDETVDLLVEEDRCAAHRACELHGPVYGLVGCLRTSHYLHEVHPEPRVEKVHVQASRRAGRDVGELADADRGRVAGQHGIAGSDAIQLGEDRLLYVHVLEHRLDHKIGIPRRFFEIGRDANAIDCDLSVALSPPALLNLPSELTAVRFPRLAELLGMNVLEHDIDPVKRRLLRDLRAHASRADHRKLHLTEKMRVTVFTVAILPSMPSMRSLPRTSFSATPRPTSSS